jgi:hypothetical protein
MVGDSSGLTMECVSESLDEWSWMIVVDLIRDAKVQAKMNGVV